VPAQEAPIRVPLPEPFVVEIDGVGWVRVRPLDASDEETLRYGIARLSPRSSYNRFLAVRKGATEDELHYLTRPDQAQHLAIGAELVSREGRDDSGIGVARSIFIPGSGDLAEYAIAISDDFQGHGVGRVLLDHLSAWAWRTGVRRWYSIQLASNQAVLRTTQRVAIELDRRPIADGAVEIYWALTPPSERGR